MPEGFQGRPAEVVDALHHTLVKGSHLAVNLDAKLAELDINPLIGLPAGRRVKAAPALVVFRPLRRNTGLKREDIRTGARAIIQ